MTTPLHLTLAATNVRASTSTRTISGVAVVYATKADASTGPVIFEPGSLHMGADLSRVKLLIDHDHAQPVGYLTEAADTDTEMTVTFHVPAGPAGDKALADASNGLRDGLSVGVWADEDGYSWDDDYTLRVSSGTLREISLCAIPALDDARVSDVAAHRRPTNTTKENTMPDSPVPTPPAQPAPAAPSTEVAASTPPAAPEPQAPPVTPAGPGSGVRLVDAAAIVAGVIRTGGGAAEVRAALSDITPASVAPGEGQENPFLRPAYIGELWTARRVARNFIDSITKRPLTSLKVYGWRWVQRAEVDAYTGNKTEIPSGSVSTEPAEANAQRVAGGWDVDRVYVDLGDPSLIQALFEAATDDYALKSEAAVVTQLLAAATEVPAQSTLTGALVALGSQAAALGARIDFVGFAPDVWGAFAGLNRNEVPWWLGSGDSINLGTTTGQVGGMRLFVDTTLPAGTILAGDSRAATFYEVDPPIRVQAVDLPRGGVDIAVFGYHALIVNDPRALLTTTVTAPVEGAALMSGPVEVETTGDQGATPTPLDLASVDDKK